MGKYTGIIILNFNNFEDTINCIESVVKINTAPVKYIVVDNGSSHVGVVDVLDKYLRKKFLDDYLFIKENERHPKSLPLCTFLVSGTNNGYACGNKKGLYLVYGDSEIDNVMILNNDVLFIDDFIPIVSERLWSRDEYMLATPLILQRDRKKIDVNCARNKKPTSYMFWYFIFTFKDVFGVLKHYRKKIFLLDENSTYSEDKEIYMPSGSCFITKKKDFQQIGDFDPHTFLYFEEDILASKIKECGKKCLLVPSVKCIHLGAGSTKKSSSNFVFKKGVLSARYYMKKYANVSWLTYSAFYIVTTLSKFVHNTRELFR